MTGHPESIQKLIDAFTKLPGIGPKSAERIVYGLLYRPNDEIKEFGQNLNQLKDKILKCKNCQTFSEIDPCQICRDKQRNQNVICVVGRPQDITVLENTGDYQGTYHVLGGLIDPLDGITPERLNIKQLIERVKTNQIHEIILALNPDMPGETTILYLTKLLKQYKIPKITRLARGLPVGSNIEYTDDVTLSNALMGRKEI